MERKKLNIFGLLCVVAAIVACAFVTLNGVGPTRQGCAKNIKLGLDLAGGVSITYQAVEENPSPEDMADTIYKMQKRVEVYSTEAEVYQEGDHRIVVEIPGVYDADEVLNNLGNPGTISFQEYVEGDPSGADVSKTLGADANGYFNEVLSGEDIASADARTQKNTYGNSEYVVLLQLTDEGAVKFKEATARNIGNPIYIVYDGEVISYPIVNTVIDGGEAVITGAFTYEDANSLATTIRLGVLKLELQDVHSTVVGAKLGEEALSTSIKAGAVGIAIVIIFMTVMYLLPGFSAGIALLLYLTSMMCFLNALDVTLTLPGIAGIILSLGMAVDANVIIFSRIREEISAGQTVKDAVCTGFKKATSAIVDGNITTLIAAAVLYLMGTGPIKGFATTLALGIVLSMFTAMFVTRIVLYGFYSFGFTSEKAYGHAKTAKTFNFIKHKVIFFVISGILIVAGFIMMAVNHGSGKGSLNLSLDFTGGTSMTVATSEYVDTKAEDGAELRQMITDITGTTEIQLQNVQESNEIIIKTPVLEQEERAALKTALAQKYGADEDTIAEESISAVISDEMQKDAIIAVAVAAVCMLIYIWIRFSHISFGISSVLALIHDVLVVLVVYAVIRIPVGNTFIACMLTIVGYSINATIVVFDRIRENRKVMTDELDVIVNASISQTLSRSINTSLTTFITIFVLYIMGVSSIREFTLPLMAGVICGAYSSICIAGVLWYLIGRNSKTLDEDEEDEEIIY